MPNVAAIDIGSNSVRLLILDAAGTELAREMVITRLGQGVDRTGVLDEQAMLRTTLVLDQYAELVAQRQVARLRVTATSAARDAGNRQVFFERVQGSLGVTPELLSGAEEAALSFRGARTGQSSAGAPFVVMDIGGGSTEFAFGSDYPERSISLALGCVRLSERFLATDPPRPSELAAAEAYTRGLLARVDSEVGVRAGKSWLGLAGTVTSVAARALGLSRYSPELTHGYRLERAKVEQIHLELAGTPLAERGRLLLDPRRAAVIIGGSLVLLEVMRYFDVSELTVSEKDILDGLAASLLGAEPAESNA